MSFHFPRELYPSVLPSHEETNPSWDAFCCWGTFSGLNVCGVDSISRPNVVPQQAHGDAVAGERFVVEGPSVPFSSPGACAWLSQWSSREPLLAPVRAARRTARRRYEVVREWIGRVKCSDVVSNDLETYYHELLTHNDKQARCRASDAPAGELPSAERRSVTAPGVSSVRCQLSNLATGLEGLFGEVTVPKANYDVGSCINCVRIDRMCLDGKHGNSSPMLLSSVDGSNHSSLRFYSFDLRQCQGEYPYLSPVSCTALQMGTTIRQADLCTYDDDPCSLLCAVRLDDGSISIHGVRVDTSNEDPNVFKVSDCSSVESSCVALNPYWRGEWLTAANTGQVAVWSVQQGNRSCADPFICRQVQSRDSGGFAAGRKLQVHYGCHPRSAIVVEPMLVNMLDLRSPSSAVELFSLPSNLLHNHEYLVKTVQLRGQPFYHCALADHSLLLFDERFPGHCLLRCAVPCSSPATYLSMADVNVSSCESAGALLVVGCQESLEVYCYYLSMNDPAPRLCTRPWRAGPLMEFLHLDATCPKPPEASIISHRIESAALMGVTVATTGPHSAETAGQRVALFQLTSYGDVFVQTCFKQHSGLDEDEASGQQDLGIPDSLPQSSDASGSTASLSRAAVDACRSWTSSLLVQAEWVAAASRTEATCRRPHSGKRRRPTADPTSNNGMARADAHDLLASITTAYGMKAHISCNVCGVPSPHSDACWSGADPLGHWDYASTAATDGICYSCSLPITEASALRTAIENDAVLPADVNLESFMASTAHFSADSFLDPNSKLHLKLWRGDDIEESLVARDEEWRVYREARQATGIAAQPLDDSSSSDEGCLDDAGSVSGSSYTPSVCSTPSRASRQRRGSISSSAGFITTPKRLYRHKEEPKTKITADNLDEELDVVPLAFLSMSASAGPPRQLFRTPASQDRPRKQRLIQGF